MSTHIHNLFEKTMNELTSGSSIINALRQVYAIAAALKNQSLMEWAHTELVGYPPSKNFPNPYGPAAPKYRLADLTVSASFMRRSGIKQLHSAAVINLHTLELHSSTGESTFTKYFIPDKIEILERPRGTGNCAVKLPGIKQFLTSFRCVDFPESTCKDFRPVIAAASFREAAVGIRMEAIRHLMDTGLGRDPLQNPGLNIHMENSLKDQSTKVHAAGGQVGNIIAHSKLDHNSISAEGQKFAIRPQSRELDDREASQFREDIKQILHLMIDRYEDIEETVRQALQNTLTTMRSVEAQGKSVAELEDMLGDVWAKQEIAQMRIPTFIEEAISATKVLKGLGGKIASLAAGSGG